ncbi:MAG: DUF3224 domain-containing protein [Anaerolineae bacterium]|jgi:hypothetical protein
MMKKALMLLLLACTMMPMAVYAGPPVDVAGDFTYMPTGCDYERWANGNQFVWDCHDTGDWDLNGAFAGTSTELYSIAFHGAAEGGFMYGYEYAFYRGNVTFDGFVDGKEGTLEILFVGFSPGALDDWNGTWRILSGTGELANLHGQGVFWATGMGACHYEGQIHFAP